MGNINKFEEHCLAEKRELWVKRFENLNNIINFKKKKLNTLKVIYLLNISTGFL